MREMQENKQVKVGSQPQPSLSLIRGKLLGADGVAGLTSLLYSCVSHWLWVVPKVRTKLWGPGSCHQLREILQRRGSCEPGPAATHSSYGMGILLGKGNLAGLGTSG